MRPFPAVLATAANRIASSSQFTDDIDGYVFDGADGSQVTFWTAHADRVSAEHTHPFDEWIFVVEGQCIAIVGAERRRVVLSAGHELVVPRGTPQAMEVTAGTRTIHVFGGRRAQRAAESGALRLDHAVFLAWDVEATLAFYRDVLALPLAAAITGDDWGGHPWLMMVFALAEGRELVLVHLRGAARPPADAIPKDARHVALAAAPPAALDEWRRRLRAGRVDFWEEDHGMQRSLYFVDPNGLTLEITSPPSTTPRADSAQALRTVMDWIGRGTSL